MDCAFQNWLMDTYNEDLLTREELEMLLEPENYRQRVELFEEFIRSEPNDSSKLVLAQLKTFQKYLGE